MHKDGEFLFLLTVVSVLLLLPPAALSADHDWPATWQVEKSRLIQGTSCPDISGTYVPEGEQWAAACDERSCESLRQAEPVRLRYIFLHPRYPKDKDEVRATVDIPSEQRSNGQHIEVAQQTDGSFSSVVPFRDLSRGMLTRFFASRGDFTCRNGEIVIAPLLGGGAGEQGGSLTWITHIRIARLADGSIGDLVHDEFDSRVLFGLVHAGTQRKLVAVRYRPLR